MSDVVEASEDDLRVAVVSALQFCGHTFAELEAMSIAGRYDTMRSRLAWQAVSNLGDLA